MEWISVKERLPENDPNIIKHIEANFGCLTVLVYNGVVKQTKISNLEDHLARVMAERDAAIKYIPHDCDTCKHWRPKTETPCGAPGKSPCEYRKRQLWQWRGPKKEDDRNND